MARLPACILRLLLISLSLSLSRATASSAASSAPTASTNLTQLLAQLQQACATATVPTAPDILASDGYGDGEQDGMGLGNHMARLCQQLQPQPPASPHRMLRRADAPDCTPDSLAASCFIPGCAWQAPSNTSSAPAASNPTSNTTASDPPTGIMPLDRPSPPALNSSATLSCTAATNAGASHLPTSCPTVPSCSITLQLSANAAWSWGTTGLQALHNVIVPAAVQLLGQDWTPAGAAAALQALPAIRQADLQSLYLPELQADTFANNLNLTTVLMHNNLLTTLDSATFAALSQLQFLDVSFNNIKNLPVDIFANNSQLEVFQFGSNYLRAFNASTLATTPKLKFLNLTDNLLTYATLWPVPLPALTSLILDKNEITLLSADLTRGLTSLQALSINNNFLTGIDGVSLQPLTQLQVLDLHANRRFRTAMPDQALSQLSRLQYLDLSLTPLGAAPPGALQAACHSLRTLKVSGSGLTLGTAASSAFFLAGCTQLQYLDLSSQPLPDLPANIFRDLTALQVLRLESTGLTRIAPLLLQAPCRALQELYLAGNMLTTVEPTSLQPSCPNLQRLDLSNNHLAGTLSASVFSPAATSLVSLNLNNNQLTALPVLPGTNLQALSASNNQVWSLPSNMLQAARRSLSAVDLSNNRLSSLATGLLQGCTALTTLSLHGNQLRTLTAAHLSSATNLQELLLSNNYLTQLTSNVFQGLAELRSLDLSSNGMWQLPSLDSLSLLQLLDLHDNPISSLPSTIFRQLTSLVRLDLSYLQLKRLPAGLLSAQGNLSELYMPYNQLSVLDPGDLAPLTALERLSFAGNQLTEVKMEALTALSAVAHLDLSDNQLLRLEFPPEITLIVCLNVSHNRYLSYMSVIQVMDAVVSATALPFDPSFCRGLGSRYFVAQYMPTWVHWDPAVVLSQCADGPRAVDLSFNDWLSSPYFLQELTSSWFPIMPEEVKPGWQVLGRDGVPRPPHSLLQIVLAGMPIECALITGTAYLVPPAGMNHGIVEYASAASYVCGCSPNYEPKGPLGACVLKRSWLDSPGHVALVVVMALLFDALVIWAVRLCYKRWKRVRVDLELKESLLADAEHEVQALRQAWRINLSELVLCHRIDGESPGAFGAVWRADWEGLPVAVKFVHECLLELDDSLAADFASEADFLMRARHPNLVRFFGIGTNSAGAPFLVLEYVPRGALKTLLQEANPLTEGDDSVLPLQRRACIAADVARGMAYIHSLGAMHRDLKSGNVLVTESWRAKVADFGSIRDLLEGHRAGGNGRNKGQGGAGGRKNGKAVKKNYEAIALLPVTDSSPHSSPNSSGRNHSGDGHASNNLTTGVGTPIYMAFEVLQGAPYGQSADVWSYGVLLWELAMARSPDLLTECKDEGRGPLFSRLLNLLQQGKRLSIPTTGVIPEWLVEMQSSCLATEPSQRPSFSSLTELFEKHMQCCKLEPSLG